MTGISIQSSLQVCLFYEDVNDTVSALRGSWKQVPGKAINYEPIRLSAITSSRPTHIPDSLNPINGNLVPNATNVTVWTWTWEDITGELRRSMSNNNFSAPFSSGVSPDGGVIAMFSKLKDDNTYGLNAFVTDYVDGTFKSGTFKELSFIKSDNFNLSCVARESATTDLQPVVKIDPSIAPVDLLQLSLTWRDNPLLFWVNGTELETQQVSIGLNIAGPDPNPTSGPERGFPYSSLGGTVPVNGIAYYLYHQLDDLTIAEDKWSPEAGVWALSNITVGIS